MVDLHISVKLPSLDGRVAKEHFDSFRKARERDAKKILLDTIHQEIISRNLKVEGHLDESWDAEIKAIGDIRRVIAFSEDIAAPALEYGTNESAKGIVDVNAILNWASRKGIQPTYGTLKQFAFAVAKKIGKEGLPLKGGLKRPFNAAQKKAVRKIERMYDHEIEALVRRLND